jgi:hypothetical protein
LFSLLFALKNCKGADREVIVEILDNLDIKSFLVNMGIVFEKQHGPTHYMVT